MTSPSMNQSLPKCCLNGKNIQVLKTPPAVLKRRFFVDIVLNFANKLINDNQRPYQWSGINMFFLFISGDLNLNSTAIYCGICWHFMIPKLVNKMILIQLLIKLYSLLRPNQNRLLTPSCSPLSHVLPSRRLTKGIRSHNKMANFHLYWFKRMLDS